MHVTVEMNEIGLKAVSDLQQPIARSCGFFPWLVHPLEAKTTLEYLYVVQRSGFLLLDCGERLAHRRKRHLDIVGAQRAAQFNSVGPYPAHRIRRHEYFLDHVSN
jgi:hypothetical protein